MKILFLVGLLVIFTPMVFAQCNTTLSIWEQLGSSDAERLTNVQFVVDRAFGLITGDVCNGYHFRNVPANLKDVFTAFISTVFGGNPGGINNNVTGIAYRQGGLPANPILDSDNVTLLLNALSATHQGLSFTQQEQAAFKGALAAVVTSAGVPACLVGEIGQLLDATDSSVVGNGGTLSGPCQSASQTLQWRNPITHSVTIQPDQSVCFLWNDTQPHTVQETSTGTPAGVPGFGYGAAGNAVTFNPANVCGASPVPCYLGNSFTYCIQFPSLGTYTFNCGIHLNAMQATITVANPASASPSPSVVTSSSAGSSLRPTFVF
jgi:plastocyanin